jgi:uncharacterized Tic20 family protein
MVKKSEKKKKRKTPEKKPIKKINSKNKKTHKYFLNSIILSLISLVLYYATGNSILKEIFYFSSIIFISLFTAFLIIELVILFMKILKK